MVAAVITRTGEILYSALNHVGEREAVDVDPVATPLGPEFDPVLVEPTPILGVPVVGITANHRGFMEKMGNSALGFSDPFDNLNPIAPASMVIAEWYNNAHLARIETAWLDFSTPKVLKNYHEVNVTIEHDTRAYVGIAVETDANTKTDDARRAYRWIGLAYRKDSLRIPLNRAGRKIRVRVVAVIFNGGRFLARDVTIGYTVGGTD